MARRTTRRELVAGTLLATAALSDLAIVDPALADPVPSDADALGKVLAVERLMVLAYQKVLASGVLGPGDAYVVRIQLGHELEHVTTLAGQLKARGAPAPTGPLDRKTADAMLTKHYVDVGLDDLHTRHNCLRLLVDLESVAEGAHFTALKTLGSAELVRLTTQMMACEAQHWTVLSGLRNPGQYVKSVPWPFVTGSS